MYRDDIDSRGTTSTGISVEKYRCGYLLNEKLFRSRECAETVRKKNGSVTKPWENGKGDGEVAGWGGVLRWNEMERKRRTKVG